MDKRIDQTAEWLVLIGALNVGLTALNMDIVQMIPIVKDYALWVAYAIGAGAAYLLLKKFDVI